MAVSPTARHGPGKGGRRRRFIPAKSDFLPEESFQSLSNYGKALSQTPQRFVRRLFARSDAEVEQYDIRKRSENDMKRNLRWWDLMWFGTGGVIGAGIFVLTGQEAHRHAGPSIILSYVAAGISAMLSVFCYTEFAVEIPVAGGAFAYLRVELGDFMAFIAAGNIILDSMLGAAAVSRAWTSYFATLLNHHPNDFRISTSLAKDYSLLDPMAVTILILTGTLAIWSTRAASIANWTASIVQMFIILFVIVAGCVSSLVKVQFSNLTPFMPYGIRGTFKAASIIFFAYGGFDSISTLAEETADPGKDIPIGLVGSMSIITLVYCFMALTLSLMEKYTEIDSNAGFSVAFKKLGWNWAQYVVALCALKGMTSVLLVNTLGKARYLTHIARTHLIPPWFALVNEKTGTPINATVVKLSLTAVLAFFTDLSILSSLHALINLFLFMLVAVALLVRRYYVKGETSTSSLHILIVSLIVILASSIATAVYWRREDSGWLWYTITIPVWFLGTLGLAIFVPPARKPTVWGCPLLPWLPSLSIAINIFLLGSIANDSFIKFAAWIGITLLYYFFFGLHASYDTARSDQERSQAEQGQQAASGASDKNLQVQSVEQA